MPPDLYTQWLLIPPGPRPPNHYALLGLSPFTAVAQQIEDAAGRQLERLDRYALVPDLTTREACQRMMNEVARARVILVSPEKRRVYDDELLSNGFQLPASAPAVPPAEPLVRGVAEVVEHDAHPDAADGSSHPHDAGAHAAAVHAHASDAHPELHPELADAAQAAQHKRPARVRHPGRGIAFAAAALILAGGIGFAVVHHLHSAPLKPAKPVATVESKPASQPGGIGVTPPKPSHPVEIAVAPRPKPVIPPAQTDVPDTVPNPKPSPGDSEPKWPEFFGIHGKPDSPTTRPSNPPAKPDKTPEPTRVATTPKPMPPVVPVASEKAAIPNAAALQAATAALEKTYKDDLASAAGRDNAVALSQRLLEAGIEKQGDPAERYALFIKARDLALGAGDLDAVIAAVNQLEGGFLVDGVKMKSDVVMGILTSAKDADARRSAARDAIPVIDEALYADRYAAASPLAEAALTAARESNDWGTARDIVVRVLEIRSGLAAYGDFVKASATLGETPNDPAANLTTGLYHCLWKGDWTRGLAMVAQGNDPALRDLAVRETTGLADAAAQTQAGDDWWAYGEKQESIVRQKVRAHAGFWYRKALPTLDGLARNRVERRLAAIGRMAVQDISMSEEDAPRAAPSPAASGLTLAQGPAAGIVPLPRIRADVAPIPSADAQKDAGQQVMKLAEGLKVERWQDARTVLTQHVWEAANAAAQAGKTDPTDLASLYIMLLETVRLSTETGQLGMMSQAADLLGDHFAIDVLDLKFQAFSRSNLTAGGEDRLRHLIEGASELRDAAVEAKEFATASKFAALAEALAHRSADPAVTAAVHTANAKLADWPQVQLAINTLEGKRSDPDANTTVGRFLCFVAGNWSEGLKNLAQGSDPRLKSLSTTELRNPASAEDQKALADGWWDIASQNPVGQMELEWHAAHWYHKALPDLPASVQALLTARLRGLSRYNSQLPAIGDPQLPDDPRMPDSKCTLLLTMDTGAGHGNYSAAFSPDGSHIIAVGLDRFWVWDSATGDAAGPPTVVCEPAQTVQSRTAFLDGSGTHVVALGGRGNTVTVWDVANQTKVGNTIRTGDIVDADLSPDGRFVVTANGASPASALLWDMGAGKRLGAAMPNRQPITCVRFSADGKYVLVIGVDRSCHVFNALSGAPQSQLAVPTEGDVLSAASFDPSGRFVGLLAHDGAGTICDTAGGRALLQINTGTSGQALAFSRNSLYMAAGGAYRRQFSRAGNTSGAAQVFDLTSGKSLAGLLKHDGQGATEGGLSMSFSHDGRYLVTSSANSRTARVWDIKKNAALAVAPLEHLQMLTSVGFDLPARHVVTACADGTVRVWALPG